MYMNTQQYMNPTAYPMLQNPAPVPVYQQAYNRTIPTEFYQVRDDDKIILLSFEEYLARQGYTPNTVRPEEWVRIVESAEDIFYSDIVQRLTRIFPFINYASEDDDRAKGLKYSLAHHMRNPRFISIMMKQLYQENNQEANGFAGAFLCTAASMYLEEMRKLDEAEVTEVPKPKKDKDSKDTKLPTPPSAPKKSHVDENVIASMYQAAMQLLAGKYEYVKNRCIGIEQGDALAIAAYLAMNNEITIKELIKSDLPLTAELLQNDQKIGSDPGNIIAAALNLQKADYAKLSVNQTKFVDSLTKWVYSRLDSLPPTACLQYLVSVYHTSAPGDVVKTNLIQLKDCGTQYPQLIQVVRALKMN